MVKSEVKKDKLRLMEIAMRTDSIQASRSSMMAAALAREHCASHHIALQRGLQGLAVLESIFLRSDCCKEVQKESHDLCMRRCCAVDKILAST